MDYMATSTNVTILPADNMECVEIPITDDPLAMEGDETFTVTITPPPGVPADPGPSIVTITDNDGKSTYVAIASTRDIVDPYKGHLNSSPLFYFIPIPLTFEIRTTVEPQAYWHMIVIFLKKCDVHKNIYFQIT